MRTCRKCKEAKNLSEYGKCLQYKDGINTLCKICNTEYSRIYKRKHYKIPENRQRMNLKDNLSKKLRKIKNPLTLEDKMKLKIENAKYYKLNKEKINEQKKKYRIRTRNKRNEYLRKWSKDKYENDLKFKLSKLLRERIRTVTKGKARKGSAVLDLGCSFEFFRKYMEAKFKSGMTWENHGKDSWHIDHIKPLSLFNLENREEFLMAVHYTNLQPLWAIENWKKHNNFSLQQRGASSQM